MWGKLPLWISDNCAIEVKNLSTARDWYTKTFGLREVSSDREGDSGRPFVDLSISSGDTFLTLVERDATASAQSEHVIFFAKNPEKARQGLIERGAIVEAIARDSGGNRFFRLQDPVGNAIEVCVEPG